MIGGYWLRADFENKKRFTRRVNLIFTSEADMDVR
jgi:hypothetical protein